MSVREDYINDVTKPLCIWDKHSATLFHAAERDVKVAWNRYAQDEVDRINASGHLDSYDTVNSYYQWGPALSFSQWLENGNG